MLQLMGYITGLAPMLTQVINNITDLQKLKVKAQSDHEIREIDAQIAALHDRQQALQAEAASRLGVLLNGGMRFLMALPIAAYVWKIYFWDKVVGSFAHCASGLDKVNGKLIDSCATFTTDGLDSNLWALALGIAGFYFLATWNKK